MRLLTILSVLLIMPISANAQSLGEAITYTHGETELEGYWVNSQCGIEKAAPLVLIVHQWKGITDHERKHADLLAEKCYNAFVIDMYGKGIRPSNNEEAAAESSKYKNNPELARSRMQSALSNGLDRSDASQAAIMGYCFGGTMALELARSGANIEGAVSFHGGLGSKVPATEKDNVQASVLVHHGDADPHVKPEEVDTFLKEMRDADADWYFVRYADAVHAFTEVGAGDDPSTGVAYNEEAYTRSWQSTLDFFEDVFAEN